MKRPIYNFVFPHGCPEVTIFDYHFSRADDYRERVQELQHRADLFSEFKIRANTGSHAVTGYVELPKIEKVAVLEWAGESSTALMDILLLISLFTGREVFAGPPGTTGFAENVVIARDPRIYQWGGGLRTSVSYRQADETGIATRSRDIPCNVGFEETLTEIYALIRSEEWRHRYGGGYFLFLARIAFHQPLLEPAFTQCWTIWEHLFAVHNRSWLSDQRIRGLGSDEKIAFILTHYDLASEIDNKVRSRIAKRLSRTRNRFVHFGRFPEESGAHEDAERFIRLTESVIARTLNLPVSNVFNIEEWLKDFLGESKGEQT